MFFRKKVRFIEMLTPKWEKIGNLYMYDKPTIGDYVYDRETNEYYEVLKVIINDKQKKKDPDYYIVVVTIDQKK